MPKTSWNDPDKVFEKFLCPVFGQDFAILGPEPWKDKYVAKVFQALDPQDVDQGGWSIVGTQHKKWFCWTGQKYTLTGCCVIPHFFTNPATLLARLDALRLEHTLLNWYPALWSNFYQALFPDRKTQ